MTDGCPRAASIDARLQDFLERHLRFFETDDDDERVALRTLEWGSPEELGPELEAWALAAVRRLAEVRTHKLPLALRLPVFLVLARAGVETEPDWDRMLPLGPEELEIMLALECLEAVPEGRQEAALVTAVEGLVWAGDIVLSGLRLLEEFPSLPLLELVLRHAAAAARAPKKKRMPTEDLEDYLDALAEEHPELAPRILRYRQNLPDPPLLEVFVTREPRGPDSLSKTEQAQLAAAGRSFDGEACSAAERLADDGSERSFLGQVRLLKIVDGEGSPAYDAWLFLVESGVVFEADTTREVAGLVQGEVRCDDPDLAAALQALF